MARSKKPREGQAEMFATQEQEPQPTSAVTGLPTEAHARRTDPSTSHAAAKSITGLTKKQLAVHAMLRKTGPMTDDLLVRTYRECIDKGLTINGVEIPDQSPSGIRTRRSELADHEPPLVKVQDIVKLSSGRKGRRWVAIAIGEAMER